MSPSTEDRIRNAWLGRVSGCMLGKPVEGLSMMSGYEALSDYLRSAEALPLRDYVPLIADTPVAAMGADCCRETLVRAVPDDDINYTVLSLLLLEQHGLSFTTADVGRAWLRLLPGAMVFTAERDAYLKLLDRGGVAFTFGGEPGFDLAECSDNQYNDWIGAQIRADMYGWVLPGDPVGAAELAARDASLSHRGEGVYGAQAVAAMGAAIAGGSELVDAVETAMTLLPVGSDCVEAMELGLATAVNGADGPETIRQKYDGMSAVHTVNNLALVVWGLIHGADDFGVAIGDTVAAGWDTDCNGATVGALWGLTGRDVPAGWADPWHGRVMTSLAGHGEFVLEDLVQRTVALVSAA